LEDVATIVTPETSLAWHRKVMRHDMSPDSPSITIRFQSDMNLTQITFCGLRVAASLRSISEPQKLPAWLAFLILRS
jgi:hypothetical protein